MKLSRRNRALQCKGEWEWQRVRGRVIREWVGHIGIVCRHPLTPYPDVFHAPRSNRARRCYSTRHHGHRIIPVVGRIGKRGIYYEQFVRDHYELRGLPSSWHTLDCTPTKIREFAKLFRLITFCIRL